MQKLVFILNPRKRDSLRVEHAMTFRPKARGRECRFRVTQSSQAWARDVRSMARPTNPELASMEALVKKVRRARGDAGL